MGSLALGTLIKREGEVLAQVLAGAEHLLSLEVPSGLSTVSQSCSRWRDTETYYCITERPALAHGEVATELRSWSQIFSIGNEGKPGVFSRRGDLRSGFVGLIGVCQVEQLEQSWPFWPWLQAVKPCLLL